MAISGWKKLTKSVTARGRALVSRSKPAPVARYMRGEQSPFFTSWKPALRDQGSDVAAGYAMAAARTIDMIHNSGWLAGAVSQAVASTIGTGLRLAAKPDIKELGWTQDEANEWSRSVERRWEAWANEPMECDAGGRMNMGEQTGAVLRSFFSHGEGLGMIPLVKRPTSQSQTKVQLVPPHRLTQETDPYVRMHQGVRMDQWGLPISYRMRLADRGLEQIVDVLARGPGGRLQVVHVFEGDAGTVRGITPLASALRVLRQFDQLSDATLQASLIHAIFAATVQSEAPTDEILRALQDDDEQTGGGLSGGGSMSDLLNAKAGWYENTKIDFGRAGKIAHLFPGEELKLHGSQSPNDTYEAFAKFLLREIARSIGMTFETFTGDYTGATYSSVRMATSEIWPIILRRRSVICARFNQRVYEGWLAEEIANGLTPFPGGINGFIEKRAAAIRADWRGPAKPQADDLKTAKAHETYYRLGLTTAEQVCADLGQDWEDVYEQRKREKDRREQLGINDDEMVEVAKSDPVTNKLLTED